MTKMVRTATDESALDLVSHDGAENLLRFGVVDPIDPKKIVFGFYINSGGHMFSCLSYTLSGTVKRHPQPDGDTMYEILPPDDQPAMMGVWSDVPHGITVRAANIHGPESEKCSNFRGLDRLGEETFAVRPSGTVECQGLKVGGVTITAEQLEGLLKLLEGKP